MLRAEQEYHLREAAFCDDAERRCEHRGVVRWLGEWLSGATQIRYAAQLREKLSPHEVPEPKTGTPWMEDDGLGGEEVTA